MTPRCTRTLRNGAPCARPAGKSGVCSMHDPEQARARGRKGGSTRAEKYRAERAAAAEALRLESVSDLRAMLAAASREAYRDGDWNVVVSAVRVGVELLRVGEMEQDLATIKAMLCEQTPGAQERFERLPS